MTAEIIFDANWPGEFSERLKTDGPWSNWEMYKLSAEVQQTLAIPEFEGLRAPLYLPDFTPLPISLRSRRKSLKK